MIALTSETARELDVRAAKAQRAGRIPGLSAGVARHGVMVWHGGFGSAHLERPGETPSDVTRYQIASNTKTFVAVVIMALRDEGKLDLDAPLSAVLPDVTHGDTLTIRGLLSHASGLQREPFGDVFDSLTFPGREALLADLKRAERVLPPHTRFHYSNLGYALLGEVISRLDGGDWFASIERRLLQPLGMTSTTLGYPDGFENDPQAAGAYFVPPYSDVAVNEPVFDSRAVAPAAGMVSCVRDLARWGGFVADPDPAILAPATLAEMCEPQIVADIDRWSVAWGLGFMVLRRGDRLWVGHTGGWPGAITGVFTHRQSATTGVALMNATHSPDPADLAAELAEFVEENEPEPPLPWTPGVAVPTECDGLLGVWFSEGREFTFFVEKGVLCAKMEGLPEWKEPARFEPEESNMFRTVAGRERGERLHVTRDEHGDVTHLNWATYRFTREPLKFGGWHSDSV